MTATPSPEEAVRPETPRDEEVLFDGHPALFCSIGEVLLAVFTLGLAILVFSWKRQALHYRVTTQRIVVEKGFFSKRMEQLDVYRLIDYTVEIPFGQRLVGTGNLILKSMDQSTPEVRLTGLKTDVRGLYENLRRATELERQRRGVRVVDAESHQIS